MEISIMFSDIKGFTALSEQLDPNRLAEMLGLYLDTLSCIIQRDTQGTIDKYIGDAIMAIWNAPEPVPDHPQMACLAALRCRDAARSLAQAPEWREFPVFETRFGLHCAKALVGHFGARDRMNYTAIGDAINLASRLLVCDFCPHKSLLLALACSHKQSGCPLAARFCARQLARFAQALGCASCHPGRFFGCRLSSSRRVLCYLTTRLTIRWSERRTAVDQG